MELLHDAVAFSTSCVFSNVSCALRDILSGEKPEQVFDGVIHPKKYVEWTRRMVDSLDWDFERPCHDPNLCYQATHLRPLFINSFKEFGYRQRGRGLAECYEMLRGALDFRGEKGDYEFARDVFKDVSERILSNLQSHNPRGPYSVD